MDVTPEEEELVRRYRGLRQDEKKAVLASQNSFKNWLQTSLSSIWNKVSSFFDDVWNFFKRSVVPRGKFHNVWVDHNTTK